MNARTKDQLQNDFFHRKKMQEEQDKIELAIAKVRRKYRLSYQRAIEWFIENHRKGENVGELIRFYSDPNIEIH